jgi:hypothetical protein
MCWRRTRWRCGSRKSEQLDWLTPVDIYCERTSAAFWAEPANALTNLSSVLAAL